jgi:hypothetical protein
MTDAVHSHDEFVCPDCGQLICSLPARDPPPTICATCQWLRNYVPDLDERAELRARLAKED